VKKTLNIQELLHCKSKHYGTKPMHPSLLSVFQRHQEHDLKHFGLVDLITTKQNKLPSFIYVYFKLPCEVHHELIEHQTIVFLFSHINSMKHGIGPRPKQRG